MTRGWMFAGAAFVVLAMLQAGANAPAPDLATLQWVEGFQDSTRHAWALMSDVLSYLVAIPALVVAAIVASRRGVPAAWPVAALAGLASLGVGAIIKPIFERSRPPIAQSMSFAFPSGHTATSAILLGAAWILVARPTRHAKGLAWLVVVLTAATGAARVLAGEHWLSDVLASAAYGYLVVWALGHARGLESDGLRSGPNPST